MKTLLFLLLGVAFAVLGSFGPTIGDSPGEGTAIYGVGATLCFAIVYYREKHRP